jgi:hypothetical protein
MTPQSLALPLSVRLDQDLRLRSRICAEFAEMPGLRLTLPQAARLVNIDAVRCGVLLGGLVRSGQLATDGNVFRGKGVGRR